MKTKRSQSAFTLLELLTVVAIIGILAAIALPNLGKFKPNVMAAATRQLLDDVARARQLAMSQRTTVFMVFVPAQFWQDPAYARFTPNDLQVASSLLDKQLTAYNFVTVRSLGDQPGRWTGRYIGQWKTLPDGAFIVPHKFGPRIPPTTPPAVTNMLGQVFPFIGFSWTTNVPFPLAESAKGMSLPYIAFNYMGQLVDDQGNVTGQNESIPLALGSISYSRNQDTKQALAVTPTVSERPVGNSTNAFNVVNIDFLTGRARVERLEVQ